MTHPETWVSDPGWDEALVRWNIAEIPDDIYGCTVTGQPPPDGLSLWLSKREPGAEGEYYGAKSRCR